jgi:hypothetical protein
MKKMKQIISLGAFISACIILMASSASAVEYRTVIEQNTKIVSQEITNSFKTVLDKSTELIPTIKTFHGHILVLLMLKFIKLILSIMEANGININSIILKFIIRVLFNNHIFIKLLPRTIGGIIGFILINIFKIIRFPFKLITKSVTLLIILLRLAVLSSLLHIRILPKILQFISATVH